MSAPRASAAPELARHSLRYLALELVLWLTVAGLFLFVYVGHFGVSRAAIVPHLRVVLAMFCSVAAVRLALAAFLPQRMDGRAAAAAVVSLGLGIALLYYALVLIGLRSWGRVVSRDLIESYAAQAGPLADALGVSLLWLGGALVAGFCLVFGGAYRYLGRYDWARPLRGSTSRAFLTCVMLCTGGFGAVEWYRFAAEPTARHGEPLGLTFFPDVGAHEVLYHAIDHLRADTLDRLEDQARAAYAPRALTTSRNVVLIVVDALRPDHMGVYGYHRDTTPYLSALARDGRLRKIDAMRSTCSNSACGLLSLFSSKYVHEFSLRPFTLYEALQKHGYRVHLILGGDHASFYGLKELYGTVDSYFDGSMAQGKYVNDDEIVLDRARSLPQWDGVPVMIQFHLMSAHVAGRRAPQFGRYAPAANYFLNPRVEPSRAVNFYDNGVLQADAEIEQLLGVLRRKGYLAEAVVAITADHGEALGEHGRYAHANGVDEEVLRIPLLLIAEGYRAPPLAAARPASSIVDVAPTLLEELGVPPPRTWSGLPLQRSMGRDYVYFQDRHTAGFVDQRNAASPWKYWLDTRTGADFAFPFAPKASTGEAGSGGPTTTLRREWRLHQLGLLPGATGVYATHAPQ